MSNSDTCSDILTLNSGTLGLTGIHREQKMTFNNTYNAWKMNEKYFHLYAIFSI